MQLSACVRYPLRRSVRAGGDRDNNLCGRRVLRAATISHLFSPILKTREVRIWPNMASWTQTQFYDFLLCKVLQACICSLFVMLGYLGARQHQRHICQFQHLREERTRCVRYLW